MRALFTSIKKLRNSTAIQSRVTQVAHHLRNINKEWKDDWWFPIAVVGVSNGSADMEWVREHTNQHLNADAVSVIRQDGTVVSIQVEALVKNLDDVVSLNNSTPYSTYLEQLDTVLSDMVGGPTSWTSGLHSLAVQSTLTAADVATMGSTTDLKATGQSTPEVSRADAAYETLMHLDADDVLAVIMRVNTAKGPLLKGAASEEQQAFIKHLIGEDVTV